MHITSCAYMVFPPQFLNIRKIYFGLENYLQEYYRKPMVLVPLPSDAPIEISRITGVSKDGFSSGRNATDNLRTRRLALISAIITNIKKYS